MVKAKLYRQNYTQKHIHTHSQKREKEEEREGKREVGTGGEGRKKNMEN